MIEVLQASTQCRSSFDGKCYNFHATSHHTIAMSKEPTSLTPPVLNNATLTPAPMTTIDSCTLQACSLMHSTGFYMRITIFHFKI